MKKQQNGFTLIELLIVVAIIGILAAVSLPLYRDYVIRTKAGAAITSITAIKAAVALNYSMTGDANLGGTASVVRGGAAPTGWDNLGMMTPNPAGLPKEVQGISVAANGDISVTLTDEVDDSAAGHAITFIPTHSVNHTSWRATYDGDLTDNATPVINNLISKTIGNPDAAEGEGEGEGTETE